VPEYRAQFDSRIESTGLGLQPEASRSDQRFRRDEAA
jgi:hypothetical protein